MNSILKVALAAAAVTGIAVGTAVAQDHYPSRPITFIVPYSPGATDTLARTVAEVMSEELGVPIVVESKPGAGGTVGAREVATSDPDGYTALFAFASVHTVGPHQRDLGYDFDDLQPVARVATGPNLLAARVGTPFTTLDELIAYAQENPGAVSFGTAGTGGLSHLHGEAFSRAAGIELFHIPFQGVTPAIAAALAGDIDLVIGMASSILPQDEAGKLVALAQFGEERASVVPQLPTFRDAGVDASLPTLIGMWVPAGTPEDAVEKLSGALQAALETDQIRDYGNTVLVEFSYADTGAFAGQLATDNESNRAILEELGLAQ